MKKLTLFTAALGAAFIVATPISLNWSSATGSLLSLDNAEARVGRPLTPGSIAGVHRRVERRTYRRGVYYGAAAAGAYGAYGYYYGRPYSYGQSYYYGQPYYYGQSYYYGQPYYYGQSYYYGQPYYYGCGYSSCY